MTALSIPAIFADICPTQFRVCLKTLPWSVSNIEGYYKHLRDALEDLHTKGYELRQFSKVEGLNFPINGWKRTSPEQQVRDRLQHQLGGQVEVATNVSRIDLLTSPGIIEVKKNDDWKSALGQVLAYAQFCHNHSKQIHLFYSDRKQLKQLRQIESSCTDLGVKVTVEETQL